jgi:hypothetical protein
MRSTRLALLVLLGLTLLAEPGRAQIKRGPHFYAETPVSLKFSGDISGPAAGKSGYVLDLGLALHLGVGVTSFVAQANDRDHDIHTEIRYRLFDVFTFFDTGDFSWRVGYGKGTLHVQPFLTKVGDSYAPQDGDAKQVYVTVGYFLTQDFALDLGYHSLSAQSEHLIQNGFFDLGTFKVNASAVTAGLQVVF